MKSRPQNRGLSYYRRSDDKQEASLGQQHGWARETADKMGVVFRGTLADVERMRQQKLSHHEDIYIDDAITGGDLSRPGFLQFLADAKADPTVSTVFVFKRDRLAPPARHTPDGGVGAGSDPQRRDARDARQGVHARGRKGQRHRVFDHKPYRVSAARQVFTATR